jgi:hypothetical protein
LRSRNKKKFRKYFFDVAFFSLAALFLLSFGYIVLEPVITSAAVDTDDVLVNLSVLATISLNSPTDVNMSPDIVGSGSSTGSTTWTVTTNNSAGYKLEVAASGSPAMQGGGDYFTDYTEFPEGTPETWSVSSSNSEFGFGATGSYIETKFGAGKYMGFNSTTKEQIAHEGAETSGSDTTVIFRAEVGSSKFQPSATYTATVTATATTL